MQSLKRSHLESLELGVRKSLLAFFLGILPSALKVPLYKLAGAKIGKGASIGFGSFILANSFSKISLGDYSDVGRFTFIVCSDVSIGNYSELAMFIWIWGAGRLEVANKCYIGPRAIVNLRKNNFIMGEYSGLGPSSVVYTHGQWLPSPSRRPYVVSSAQKLVHTGEVEQQTHPRVGPVQGHPHAHAVNLAAEVQYRCQPPGVTEPQTAHVQYDVARRLSQVIDRLSHRRPTRHIQLAREAHRGHHGVRVHRDGQARRSCGRRRQGLGRHVDRRRGGAGGRDDDVRLGRLGAVAGAAATSLAPASRRRRAGRPGSTACCPAGDG